MKLKWQTIEKAVARRVGGRLEPASGSVNQSNDVRTANFSIEVKVTEKRSFTLKYDDLLKLRDRARRLLKTPAMVVHFEPNDGGQPLIVWIVFDENVELDDQSLIVV